MFISRPFNENGGNEETIQRCNDANKQYYTVDELYESKIIPIGKSKLYQLVKSKGFPAIRIGRRIVIKVSGLQKWFEEQTMTNLG